MKTKLLLFTLAAFCCSPAHLHSQQLFLEWTHYESSEDMGYGVHA
jgi:hypothetical protein